MEDGSGRHSGGTAVSQWWFLTPPRPAMLLWPESMKMFFFVRDCFWVEFPISIVESNFFYGVFLRCGYIDLDLNEEAVNQWLYSLYCFLGPVEEAS